MIQEEGFYVPISRKTCWQPNMRYFLILKKKKEKAGSFSNGNLFCAESMNYICPGNISR